VVDFLWWCFVERMSWVGERLPGISGRESHSMRIQATRTADGLLIPMVEEFERLDRDSILLEVEVIEPTEAEDYSALDRLVGLCDSGKSEGSVKHDEVIYGSSVPDGLR
jgi:hypothetical protein